MGVFRMKAIKYIGSKPQGVKDLICGTGLTWAHGETVVVTDEQAEKLLRYPEIWAIDGETTTEQLTGLESATTEASTEADKDKDEEEEVFDNPPPNNLERMNKADIAQYAMREHGLQFHAKDTKAVMIEAISSKLGGKKFE
jgi:hypothetical protein